MMCRLKQIPGVRDNNAHVKFMWDDSMTVCSHFSIEPPAAIRGNTLHAVSCCSPSHSTRNRYTFLFASKQEI